MSCLLVSHDALDILSWADTVFFMRHGSIVQKGTAEELYKKPVDEYCAALLGAYNLIDVSAIPALKDRNRSGKKFFCRPGQVSLTDAETSALRGTVKKILYWGSYYTIDILFHGQLICVQTAQHHLSPGEQTGLEFEQGTAWYI
ncbi:MAG: ABC transporter ATP-binding protein [Chitinophagaceae bacterium]|nr:MAG: ABC transporter ATP-binding protein [Chitinophagaceae bacterium]